MNREILFKAKRIDNGEWAEGFYTYCDGKYYIRLLTDENSRYVRSFFEVDASTICQYTGLTDKNGNKIWENDIVNCIEAECCGQISWNESEACFCFDLLMEDGGFEENNIDEYVDCMEVVGNIFDNPELLEGGAEE